MKVSNIFSQIGSQIAKWYGIPFVKYTVWVLGIFIALVIIWQIIVNRKKLVALARTGLWDEDVYRRMGGAAIWTILIFILGWLIGFFIIKEGSLEKTFLAAKIFGIKGKVWLSVLKLISHHLILIAAGIIALNHFRAGKLPLGYVFFFIYVLTTSMIAGSASYIYPANAKLKALNFFNSFGLAEMISYLFFTVSAAALPAFQIPLTGTKWEKVRSLWPVELKWDQIEVFLWGLAFLAISVFAEMRLILFYKRNEF